MHLLFVFVCVQMTDDPEVVASRDPKRSAPRLACFPGDEESQYFLFIENEVLCITQTFHQAFVLWFISHYVFNLEYATQIREVCLFIQEFVFKLPATSGIKRQKTANYLTVSTDIHNYLA